MADFELAFDRTMRNEGVYSNDPDDAGKETCFGISRKYHPNWIGWKTVDSLKKSFTTKSSLNNALKKDNVLLSFVRKFYKENFWDCFELDDCKSNGTAYLMFDTAVNIGKVQAIKMVQRVLGLKETGRWSLSLLNELVK